MRAYEGMFLVDDGRVSDNFQAVADHIRGLIERHGGKVLQLEKWDSRRLAYEIDGKRRGAYILTHFDGDPAQITALHRDCRISNIIIRALILRQDDVGMSLEDAEEAQRLRRRQARAAAEAREAPAPADQPKPEPEPAPQPPPAGGAETAPEPAPPPAAPEPVAPPAPAVGAEAAPEPAPQEAPAEEPPAEEKPA